ncbi:hypothetical protein DPMN_033094 [Dreissena polymorpha]|uniref:Uncharacterized protein n=1 Tax=Dreissena polymorpha TaxID=45954 RepID=A0A9D4M312_DREPO|nr:hypothetical protein DPMN_033094 [Dreissena polymorpha]
MSVYRAARLYRIPESTLCDRTLGLQPVPCSSEPLLRPWPQTLFSVNDEERFVCHVKYMAEISYSYSMSKCVRLATDCAIRKEKEKSF